MRALLKSICLFLLFNIMLVRSIFTVRQVEKAKSKLRRMFPGGKIPGGMPEWVAVLEDSLRLYSSCLPTRKVGRCYNSGTCRLPKLKVDGRMVPFTLQFCKDPYQIIMHFQRFKLPWWAKVGLKPVIVNFKHHDNDGVFTISSATTITASVRFFRLRFLKASFYVDGILRYDCTKPKNDWKKRVAYNLKAPNKQYTSVFYKLKMRIEIKRKSFSWFRFKWKCRKCEDIVNESGSYDIGHPSCAADMKRYNYFERRLSCDGYNYFGSETRHDYYRRCGTMPVSRFPSKAFL